MPAPVDAPEHLPQPSVAEMDLPTVMDALSDPIRLAILHRYLVDAAGGVRSCGWVGIDRPKSTLTHHFRVLREAGLLEQHQEGLTRSSRVRFDEVQQRFPGLLDLVFAWEVPAALMRADLRADVREDLRADLRADRSEDVTA